MLASSHQWSCPICTYLNDQSRQTCDMCDYKPLKGYRKQSENNNNHSNNFNNQMIPCTNCLTLNYQNNDFCTDCMTELIKQPNRKCDICLQFVNQKLFKSHLKVCMVTGNHQNKNQSKQLNNNCFTEQQSKQTQYSQIQIKKNIFQKNQKQIIDINIKNPQEQIKKTNSHVQKEDIKIDDMKNPFVSNKLSEKKKDQKEIFKQQILPQKIKQKDVEFIKKEQEIYQNVKMNIFAQKNIQQPQKNGKKFEKKVQKEKSPDKKIKINIRQASMKKEQSLPKNNKQPEKKEKKDKSVKKEPRKKKQAKPKKQVLKGQQVQQDCMISQFNKQRLTQIQFRAITHMHKKAKLIELKLQDQVTKRFQSLGYNRVDLQNLKYYIQNYAPIIIHIHVNKHLQFFNNDTHYRNLFETKSTSGANDIGWRANKQNKMFDNIYKDATPAQRIKYGVVNFTNDPKGVSILRQYGDSYFLLKQHVRERCTLYHSDNKGNWVSDMATLRYPLSIISKMTNQQLKSAIMGARGLQAPSKLVRDIKEIQIHGPIQFSKDIQRLYADKIQLQKSPQLFEMVKDFCKKNDIEYQLL